VWKRSVFKVQRGLFIVFEGIDGCGKTTQVKMLAERFNKLGQDVVVTREPGGTRIGGQIRKLLLHPANGEITHRAEALLYAADRAQHVGEKILPALHAGKTVICDRFTDSTLAYQGGGRGVDRDFLGCLNELAAPKVSPNLVFVLDMPPEVAMKRLAGKKSAVDRLEAEDLQFYNRVRETYLVLARHSPARCKVINAQMTVEEVHRQVCNYLGGLSVEQL